MTSKRSAAISAIEIRQEWCKRCGICVAFCPKSVFTTDPDGTIVVSNLPACINCELCERICPDLAITLIPTTEEASTHGISG
jgi:2-oxoglutarate ferredoxin oxidoreductase subunit delta